MTPRTAAALSGRLLRGKKAVNLAPEQVPKLLATLASPARLEEDGARLRHPPAPATRSRKFLAGMTRWAPSACSSTICAARDGLSEVLWISSLPRDAAACPLTAPRCPVFSRFVGSVPDRVLG
ncbi:Os05g0444750 [Oryza sativa Japonica Group]|uniref:Os05g0444750 protein n=2 Tax=Oryza TaxID=4527 RepID=A0A0P0WN43_ORYSJ|nr:hypothetical protein EE612_029805 [Oryza sativa]KAF2931023.1 hypothetical protein DAI22_05g178700 [Oryza sativa Japonica Group]BAS94271.1 Os05g0444750 [Oryza sativa Japonica Group]